MEHPRGPREDDVDLELTPHRQPWPAPPAGLGPEAVAEVLPWCEKHRVRLGIETRSHYEQVPNQREMLVLMAEYADCPWIGAWHDFGHVQRQANLALLDHDLYFRQIAPHLIGCHVHDVQWPARDHRAPLTTGGVDLPNLLPLAPPGIPLVWEVSPNQRSETLKEALQSWRALPALPQPQEVVPSEAITHRRL